MRERHTKWATYINIIKTCLNETYHETIRMTAHEAQFGKKPTRAWERYTDPIVNNRDKIDLNKIQLRIREKGERQANRLNKLNKITQFEVGEWVLIRAHHASDAMQNIIAKFCALYEGPYENARKFGNSTYELVECSDKNKRRGIFNTRQVKKYYSDY